jgi:indolepyruvate ferredoxin oxidoreductase beta subunit
MKPVTNVILAGLGGQGVIKASDILSEAAFIAGYDVKKSELHGMSQRGGSVCSDVRFGPTVLSPMVPPGQADYLVVLASDQVQVNSGQLKPGGKVISPEMIDESRLSNRKNVNVALLGILSSHLDIAEDSWAAAICSVFPEKIRAANQQAFAYGRSLAANAPQT